MVYIKGALKRMEKYNNYTRYNIWNRKEDEVRKILKSIANYKYRTIF